MTESEFVPHHVQACAADLAGNGGLGRYVFLPGSDGRAREIADRFEGVEVRPSPRCHNLYLGRLRDGKRVVDAAAVSSGMGTPSLDIIVQELYRLGARRFLRVGTAGSLQPERVRVGDVVVATAAVRDEHASRLYVPVEYPAVASFEVVLASKRAAAALGMEGRVAFGVIHSKDSLFAREFGEGPLAAQNREYMRVIEESGVLASEMEASHLFVLAALFSAGLERSGAEGGSGKVLAGTILGVIGDDRPFAPKEEAARATTAAVDLAVGTVFELARQSRRMIGGRHDHL